jgi:hypothetical protein
VLEGAYDLGGRALPELQVSYKVAKVASVFIAAGPTMATLFAAASEPDDDRGQPPLVGVPLLVGTLPDHRRLWDLRAVIGFDLKALDAAVRIRSATLYLPQVAITGAPFAARQAQAVGLEAEAIDPSLYDVEPLIYERCGPRGCIRRQAIFPLTRTHAPVVKGVDVTDRLRADRTAGRGRSLYRVELLGPAVAPQGESELVVFSVDAPAPSLLVTYEVP